MRRALLLHLGLLLNAEPVTEPRRRIPGGRPLAGNDLGHPNTDAPAMVSATSITIRPSAMRDRGHGCFERGTVGERIHAACERAAQGVCLSVD